jgi:hypothetical protein
MPPVAYRYTQQRPNHSLLPLSHVL